jgi:hypothetical protein
MFTWTVTTPVDVIAPSLTITVPTSASSYTATASVLSLAGSASDNVSVTRVTWSNDRGGSGVATGATSWSATVALQIGTNVITVTARDAAGNSATDVLTVTYGVNRAPTLNSVSNQSTRVGQWDTFQLVAADADGDTLGYAASGLPPGLSINAVTGLIGGTPTTVGIYRVTVAVSDGTVSTTRSFNWTIKKRAGY